MADSPRRQALSPGKRLAFASVPLLLALVLLEVVVRTTGLATRCPNPYTGSPMWACDPILQFKLKPDLIVDGKPLNRAGFRTHEFTRKAPGTYRILSLGDSCTFGMVITETFNWIHEPYPEKLEHLVAERVGPGKVEVLNAGTPGYNSYQGIMLLRSKLRGLHPDLITIRYGWNDHLMSRAGRDRFEESPGAWRRAIEDVLMRTQLYPFVLRLNLEVQSRRNPTEAKPTVADIPKVWKPNVPLEQYKTNLRRLVALAHREGAEVWLLTAPHAFVTDENSGKYDEFPNTMAARALMTFSAIPSYERFVEIHDSYNDAVREIGAELGVAVIDMDKLYREHSDQHLFTSTDMPHPTQQGHDLEAEALYQKLVASGVIRPRDDRCRSSTRRPRLGDAAQGENPHQIDQHGERQDDREPEAHREHRGEDRADDREEAVHRPGPGDELRLVLGDAGDRVQPDRHEGAEADPERRETGDRDRDAHGQRRCRSRR